MSSQTVRSGPMLGRFTAGEYVFRQGDLGTEMFVVRSGSVEISRGTAAGEQRLAVLEKGDPFGEMVLLDDVAYSVSARALDDVEVVTLNRATFDRVLRGNPEISVRIMRKLTARIRSLEAMLAGGTEPIRPAESELSTPVEPTAAFVATSGERLTFDASAQVVIGREDPVTGLTPGIDLTEIDPERSSSRQHARVFRENDRYYLIEDIGTTNGTYVNGRRLESGIAAEITAGDRLRFGLAEVEFVRD